MGQALEHIREIVRENTTTPVFLDGTDDVIFREDQATHLRLHTTPPTVTLYTAKRSTFVDSVPDERAPEELLVNSQPIDLPLMLEQGPDSISGIVIMNAVTFTTLHLLSGAASAKSGFNCRALLDTGSP